MKIIAHTLVKNEESFVWYGLSSVIKYFDEILVWDTGSIDKTVEAVKSIKDPKIKFRELGPLNPKGLSNARQKMIDESSKFDWIFILDGDEIWHDDSIGSLVEIFSSIKEDVIAVPNNMLIGDIFHYQEELAGKYKIGNRIGNYNIRVIRNTPGLHVEGVYPNEAFVTKEGVKVQDLPKEKILFLDTPYLHASFLSRSDRGEQKVKYEIGKEFSKDFYYPEVFFRDKPDFIRSPWKRMDFNYQLHAFWQTPLKKIKRRII